jgi:hypothetical protein
MEWHVPVFDGAQVWESGNVSMKLDGVAVTPTFVKDGPIATVSYVPGSLFAAQSTHSVSLTYPGTGDTKTLDWQFNVGAYTLDTIKSGLGVFKGGSTFTVDGGGRTGKAGDRAADFGALAGRSMSSTAASSIPSPRTIR